MALGRRVPCNTHPCRMHTNRQPRSTRSARQRATHSLRQSHNMPLTAPTVRVWVTLAHRTGIEAAKTCPHVLQPNNHHKAALPAPGLPTSAPGLPHLHLGLAHIGARTATSAPWTGAHLRRTASCACGVLGVLTAAERDEVVHTCRVALLNHAAGDGIALCAPCSISRERRDRPFERMRSMQYEYILRTCAHPTPAPAHAHTNVGVRGTSYRIIVPCGIPGSTQRC